MIFEACERLREAHAQVGRCADSVWAPRGDSDPYRLANQELWIREWRLQEQFKTFLSNNCDSSTYSVRTVNDTIPGSRLARIYAIGRQYEPEREACYTPAYEVGHELTTAHPVNIGPPYENIECWQMPEVEMYFRELTKGHPEQDLFFSALVDSSVSEIAVEEHCKIINMRDKEWITQTPWRTILSERYPSMRDYLDKNDSQRSNSYLSCVSLLDMAAYPTPRYSATSLQELALQMKIQSAEVRAIWNDNSIPVSKSTKRQRRTPRLPMEPSGFLNNKRFNNTDTNEFYSNPDGNQRSCGYSFFQDNCISSENSRSNTRHTDYDDPKFNVFNEIDARKKIFFNKNTEIFDPPLFNNQQNINEQKTNLVGDKKGNTIPKINSFPSKKINQSTQSNADKTFKILHSPQNIDSKVLNYVRNVPATVSQEYSPSSIQGIEFNPVFTAENRPNIEEKFSRVPGAGRQFAKKCSTKQPVETFTKSDQKADKLLEALTKISQQSVDNIDDETINNKAESESTLSRTYFRQETNQIDPENNKMYILSKNENFTLNSKANFTKCKTTQFTKSDSNFDAIEKNMSNFDEKKFNLFTQFEDNIDLNTSLNKKTCIGSVDVPEFIPRFLVKEPTANLKISLSLPNISETTDIPEFYPKDYTNVPKKAASVYDKPLKNIKTKLPENNSNSINSDESNKFKSDENSIPVYQRPREFHKTTGNVSNNRQRKQQGVDYNNLIFLTSTGKDPKKWLNKEYPNRLNEFDKVDSLINAFSNLHNNYIIDNQQKLKQIPPSSSGGCIMPIDNNKFVQKVDRHTYQQNITYPVISHQNPLTRQYPMQNLSPVAIPNVFNILPGGILVSTCSQIPVLSHNIYVNQNIMSIPPNTITPRSLGVQGINQAYHSLPSTSLVPPSGSCAQNVSQNMPHEYQAVANLPPIVSHGMRVSPRNIPSKVQQPCHSKMNICPHAIKNTACQGAKRRLYSAVLSNTNTTMDSDCDELEREALEQYRPSEESLKDSSDDSIQAKYQELERLAMEQYTTSSSSASSESCALGNGNILVSETGPPGIRTGLNSESNIGIAAQSIKNKIPQIKSAIVRKSNSNLSMGSKLSSTIMLPSIGEVSNDEADSPKNTISPRKLEDNSSKRRIIVVKPTSQQALSDHSSDAEENDDYGPQIVMTPFGQKKKEEYPSTICTDRSEIEFKLSLLASVENLHENTSGPKNEYYFENVNCKEHLETKCLHDEKSFLEHPNISSSKKESGESSPVKSAHSNLPACTSISREIKSAGHNKRRQGRKAKKTSQD